MTTSNETIIAQNTAIISLLVDMVPQFEISATTKKAVKLAGKAQKGWLAQVELS